MGIQGALVNIAKAAMTEASFKLMNGLGQLLVGQAQYDEALAWYEKALAGFVGKGEEENTATTYSNTATWPWSISTSEYKYVMCSIL